MISRATVVPPTRDTIFTSERRSLCQSVVCSVVTQGGRDRLASSVRCKILHENGRIGFSAKLGGVPGKDGPRARANIAQADDPDVHVLLKGVNGYDSPYKRCHDIKYGLLSALFARLRAESTARENQPRGAKEARGKARRSSRRKMKSR